MKLWVKSAAGIGALMIAALPGVASAQMIGPCPSFVMPPPCIVFDAGRMGEAVKDYAQQYERLQEMMKQVEQTKQNAMSIGNDLTDFSFQPKAPSWSKGDVLSAFGGSTYATAAQSFAGGLYGGDNQSTDQITALTAKRRNEAFAANADGLAVSYASRSEVGNAAGRIDQLAKATASATNLREDMIANSQVRLEISRQLQIKNQLLGTLLHNRAVHSANATTPNQTPVVAKVAAAAAPALTDRDPAWDMLAQLKRKEAEVRSVYALLAMASTAQMVGEDVASVIERHRNAETARDEAYAAFRSGAFKWSSSRGQTIIDTTLNSLSRIDAQMAVLRAQPVESLAGAFAERDIDAAALVEAGLDPRQFIGTYADPIKGEWTLAMANSLLDGPLDDPIDGDENDEYRIAVMNFNNARLEEAWLESHRIDAEDMLDQTNELITEETKKAGYALNEASVEAKLRALVGEANALAQQIQASGNETTIAQASKIMTNIGNLING
jgi:hypothetical protein